MAYSWADWGEDGTYSRNGRVRMDLFEESRIFWRSSRGRLINVVAGVEGCGLWDFNFVLILLTISLMDFGGILWLELVNAVVFGQQRRVTYKFWCPILTRL